MNLITNSPTRLRILTVLVASLLGPFCTADAQMRSLTRIVAATPEEPIVQEREIDKQHLLKIFDALQAYRKDHGELPNWLSDLFPTYLKDPQILMSPVETRTGRSQLYGYGDPKMRSSYIYEFCGANSGRNDEQGQALTLRQWKTRQMEAFGPAIPILRCHLHSPVLNVAYSGDFYESSTFWETDTNTLALMKRLGPGKPGPNWKYLRVTVVKADNQQPIAQAELTAENLQTEFGPHPLRTLVSDAQGVAQVPLGSGTARTLKLRAAKEGFGNEQVNWENGNIPTELTIKLAKALTIGGRVQDESGKPIADVAVQINGLTRDEVGQVVPVEYETVKTDAAGKWVWSRLPQNAGDLSFKLSHPEFMPAEYDQASPDNSTGKVASRDSLLGQQAVMVMEPGIRLEGTVVESTGQPISGAEVLLANGENLEKRQTRKTGADGRFSFVLFETAEAQLLVQARGLAPEQQAVTVERSLKPLSITLSKGNAIKGRVVDESGKALEGATVSVVSWKDLPLLAWRSQTDAEGRFTWDSAPADQASYSITKPGYMPVAQLISASRGEDVTVRLSRSFKLVGKVIDAETKEPIKAFRIMRGRIWNPGDDQQVSWERTAQTVGSNGSYSIGLDSPDLGGGRMYFSPNEKLKFMVSADGYLPAATQALTGQGWHTNDFELKKGNGPAGIVQTPDGQPVANADVAISGIGYLSLMKTSFRDLNRADTVSAKTDAEGHFVLPAVLPSPTIIAVHERGYAEVSGDQLAKSATVVLQPWGRIEGTLMNGTKPGSNQAVMVAPKQTGPGGLNYDFDSYRTETDEQGHFTFTNVPPGTRQLVRIISRGGGSWSWSHIEPITVKAGEVTRVIYGGHGRPVIGKVVSSDPARKVEWQSGYHNLATQMPRPPSGLGALIRAWAQGPEVKAARQTYRYYAVQFAEDGTFRIEDIPPGSYRLSCNFSEGGQMGGRPIGSLNKDVVVPEMPNGPTDEPLDLGQLTLELR